MSLLAPGIFASLSLCIPPKVRSLGYSMSSLFVVPGVLALLLVGYIADHWGIRQGLLLMVPIFLIGAWTLASASLYVKSDINRVWTSTAAQAEVAYLRRQGLAKLLLVRNLDVGYDGVQVLFHVDFEIDEGEIVALLGTNGAGKSTLLKTISGLVEATNGAIVFDGRDMTYAPPNEVAGRGVVQVPGGNGVFPSLTVAENLRLAGWLHRHDRVRTRESVEHVLTLFPVLRDRLDEPAGNLSGGQQQMLTLGMAFVTRPRLLMIDELSLGLAPAVVEQLLPIVAEIRAAGTTIILVEQSVNLALTLAETAYFMEKGEIRFHGPTAELLQRPDVLRSVFLEGAATVTAPAAVAEVVPNGKGAVPSARPAYVRAPNGSSAESTPPARPRLELQEVSKRFGGLSALHDVSVAVGPVRSSASSARTAPGRPRSSTSISGFLPADNGTIVLYDSNQADDNGGRDLTRLNAAAREPASAWAVRSRTGGSSPRSPSPRRSPSRSIAGSRCATRSRPRCTCPRSPIRKRTCASGSSSCSSCSGSPTSATSSPAELSTGSRRVVDLACVLAHEPSVLLLDEPSSGIAQREAEALGPAARADPRRDGREPPGDRARRAAAALDRRSHRRPRPRRGRHRRTAERRRQRPPRRRQLSRHDPSHDRTKRSLRTRSTRHRVGRTPMQAPPPTTRRRSALVRYAPFIAVAVIIALVVVIVSVSGGDDSKPKVKTQNTTGDKSRACRSPTTRRRPRARSTSTRGARTATRRPATWRSRSSTRRRASRSSPATTVARPARPGVSADSINIVYYQGEARPAVRRPRQEDRRLRRARPDHPGRQGVHEIFESLHETYGRKINLSC